MTRHRLFHVEPKLVRKILRRASLYANEIHELESELIQILREIDQNRFFVRLGYKSLRTFCIHGLKFTHTQGQRLATEVRRNRTTFDIGQEDGIGQEDNMSEEAASDLVKNQIFSQQKP